MEQWKGQQSFHHQQEDAGNLTVKYNGKQKALNFKAGETKLIK